MAGAGAHMQCSNDYFAKNILWYESNREDTENFHLRKNFLSYGI